MIKREGVRVMMTAWGIVPLLLPIRVAWEIKAGPSGVKDQPGWHPPLFGLEHVYFSGVLPQFEACHEETRVIIVLHWLDIFHRGNIQTEVSACVLSLEKGRS